MATYQQIGNIKGAQGPKGDTGATGPKGATGAQGPKGDSPTSSEIQAAVRTVMQTLTWGGLSG